MFLFILLLGVLILVLIFIFMKEFLDKTTILCKHFRKFIVENTSFFTILFLVIFFIEQVILIILVYTLAVSMKAQLLISLSALVVVTTATLQKFIWEYKYQNVSRKVYRITYKNKRYFSYFNKLLNDHGKLLKKKG